MFDAWPSTSFLSVQLTVVVTLVFIVAFNHFTKEPWKKLPPGPPALPIVGSLPFLGSLDVREPLRKLAVKYGDVYTLYMGRRRVVVLNGYEVIKDAFVRHGHVFSGRPSVYFVSGITNGYGIVSSQGEFWREQRRYVLHVLRDFGFGRSLFEDRILEEVSYFIDELRKNADVPFYPHPLIQKSIANIISALAFGKRMRYDDPVFIRYMDVLNEAFEILGNCGPITVFPFLRYLPGDWFKVKKLLKDIEYTDSEFIRVIAEHKSAHDNEKTPPDFISAYLSKLKEEQNKKESSYSETQLRYVLADLFGAGTETSATTLTWAVIYMALHQQTQERVHAEIDDVIGKCGPPRMHHRSLLPFTKACILETQRLADIVPLAVPHAATEDTEFRGYFIPRGTMILANLYSVHHDPKLWPEPESFDPERFIDGRGKLVGREELIPFSIGKRLCLGESLARMELFLYFTSMMQHFRFRVAPGYPLPDTRGILCLTSSPKPFHIIAESSH